MLSAPDGNGYAAVFVNQLGETLTPVLVPALVTDYVETPPGSGTFVPESNYGTDSQFDFAVSNFITTNEFGSFFNTFSFAGDANFVATMVVPEPASIGMLGLIGAMALTSRRRRRS